MRALVGSLLAVSVLVSIGCGPKVQVRSTGAEGVLPSSTQDLICVARAADGRFGSQRYAGSGEFVSDRIVEALRSRHSSVRSLSVADEDDAVDACRAKHGRHLIIPTITHWEDRYTGLTGKDRVAVRVRLRFLHGDAADREVTYTAATNSAVIVREVLLTGWTNERPDELLTDRFDAAMLALVSGQPGEHRAATVPQRAR